VTVATDLGAERRAAAALVCAPGMEPARVRELLARAGSPGRALARLADKGDPAQVEARLARRGTHVYVEGGDDYPIGDALPDRPAVLLAEGDAPEVLDRPRVAVVGTRSATLHGLRDARELGRFLGEAGITVVSGLAIGVDAAAHEGALDAGGGVVGVLATGLDVVYPRRHTALFDRVRRSGLLVTESAFGAQPLRWRFPVRNRIIAALADATVVVEATVAGGARITAGYALEYGRTVLAMPGSRRNAAAAGCNALLADGAHPLLEPNDVLVALGLTPGARRGWGAPPARGRPTGDAGAILRACGGEAATVDQLVSRTALAPPAVALAVRELEKGGWIARDRGYLWPR
jgi:DNA processing protein